MSFRFLSILLIIWFLPGNSFGGLVDVLDLPAGTAVTTEGNAVWIDQSDVTADGIDAARSGVINNNQNSSLSLVVVGPKILGYYWKVSSEVGYDVFRLIVDGVEQRSISGEVNWRYESILLSAGSHTVSWKYAKDGSAASGSDAAWLDRVTLADPSYRIVTFDLGIHGARAGGGALVQSVLWSGAAMAPIITVESGWAFVGWDSDFSRVENDVTVTARFVVPDLPLIDVAPVSSGISWGGSASLRVAATANAPLSYQWYRGESGDVSSPVPGANGQLLVTSALRATERFWVRVTNAGVFTDSNSVTVAVDPPAQSLFLGGMGYNTTGELGVLPRIPRVTSPTIIDNGVVSVAAGYGFTHFIKEDGTLWAMGSNSYGQLGDGSKTARTTPIQVAGDVVSVFSAGSSTFYLKNDGSLWAMGRNDYGQLGDGSNIARAIPVRIATGVASVAAGRYHTLFVKTNGTLWAMGRNDYGQLGNGTSITRNLPVQVAEGVVAAACGWNHTLILKSGGALLAVGANTYGQLGDGTTKDRLFPVQVLTDVSAMATGSAHSLFLKADGSLWSSGTNSSGQLGDGTKTSRSVPVQIATNVNSVFSSSDSFSSMFVKRDATLWATGGNSYGQLGDGTTIGRSVPVQIAEGVGSVAVGYFHTVIVGESRTVTFDLAGHGARSGGGALVQRGMKGAAAIAPSIAVSGAWFFSGWDRPITYLATDVTITALYSPATSPVITVSPVSHRVYWQRSTFFTVAATANGPLSYQWYRGISGDTSEPVQGATTPLFVTPALAAESQFWVRVTNGGLFADSGTAVVTMDVPSDPASLAVGGMGYNQAGQLGDGSVVSRMNPKAVAAGVASVSAGGYHGMFIKCDGTLWGMGSNGNGQLGDGSTSSRSVPVHVTTDVASVSAGSGHTLFVKTDGSLWAMGSNGWGELGYGESSLGATSTPRLVATGVSAAAAGYEYSLFVKNDGSLWAVGYNQFGRLGDGTYEPRPAPVQVATGVVSVSAGIYHAMFVKTDGSLWAMGYNSDGQLGDGTNDTRMSPVQIATGVASVSAGNVHTLFVKTDGTLWAMGANYSGQLADGTTVNRKLPVQVATGVMSVSAQGFHTEFIRTDGSLWTSGYYYGPIIGFDAPLRLVPTKIGVDVVSVSASYSYTLFAGRSHVVSFDLGGRGSRAGGGATVQRIFRGAAAIAPDLDVKGKWSFRSWDKTFSAVESDLIITASYRSPSASWAFGLGLSDSDAAPDADPDGDGACNLLEYALGSSPLFAEASAHSPKLVLDGTDDGTGLILLHRRRVGASVTIGYQKSTNLYNPAGWAPADLVPVVVDPDVDGDGLVELVRISVPPHSISPKLFFRLSVSED